MKLNKWILMTSSALVCATFLPVQSTSNGIIPSITVSAQEDQVALLNRIKTNLLEQEPIVEKELVKVSDEDLLNYYESASDDLTLEDIFKEIAEHYPELKLIKNEKDYAEFKEVLLVVSNVSGKTLSELKNVDPKALVKAYQEAQLAYDDIDELVASFIDQLDVTYGELEEEETEETPIQIENTSEESSMDTSQLEDETSRVTEENTENSIQSEETQAVSRDAMNNEVEQNLDLESSYRQALSQQFNLTSDQISSISNDELLNTLSIFGLSYEQVDADSLGIVYRQLVSQFPERFNSEQIKEVANYLRTLLLNDYPVTETIVEQIADEDYLQWRREAVQQQQDVLSYIYWQAIGNYPQLFDDQFAIAKENLAENTNYRVEQLDQMEKGLILYLDYQATIGNMSYDAIAAELNERYPSIDTTSAQANISQSSQLAIESQTTIPAIETTMSQSTTNASSSPLGVVTSTTVESKGNLPQTGENQSWKVIVLAVVATVVGIILIRKKPAASKEN